MARHRITPGRLTHSPPVPWLATLSLAVFGGLSMALVHPLAPIAVMVGAALGLAGATSAFRMTLFFTAVLFLRPAEFYPVIATLQIGKLVALGALALLTLQRLYGREAAWARIPQNRWLLFLTGAVVVSSFLGSSPSSSFQSFQDVFIKILVLWLLIVNLVDSRSRAVQLQVWLAILCTILGGYALYASAAGVTMVGGDRIAAVGLLGDPNDLAMTLLVPTPFLFAATLDVRGPGRLLFGAMLVIVVGGILLTQSRGGVLGLGVGLGALMWLRLPSRKARLIMLSVIAVGGAVMFTAIKRPDLDAGEGLDTSAEHRLAAWNAGLIMFKRHPLFGVGYERFPENFMQYTEMATDREFMAAHNTFVKAFAETGLAGFVPFMMLVFTSIMASLRVGQEGARAPPGLERAVAQSQLGNLLGVLVAAFFLSQTWLWFIYIVFAQTGTAHRVWTAEEG